MRAALLLLTMALAASIAGCGVDGDLTCGFSTCAPAKDAQTGDATNVASAEGPDAQNGSPPRDAAGGMRDGQGATDATAPSAPGDGGRADDAAALEDGCVMCGLGPCCLSTHQCIASGTTCCANPGVRCGGENGACCSGVCTAARQCGATCVGSGSCAQQSDCCLGTYCDMTLHCVGCLNPPATCSQASECCSGVCRNSTCVPE